MAIEPKQPVTLLEVSHRAGIWELTRNGRFHGRYDGDQPAFDAAEAVALAIVADGGRADLRWHGAPADPGVSDASGALRIIEFRAGSTRIVRPLRGGAGEAS